MVIWLGQPPFILGKELREGGRPIRREMMINYWKLRQATTQFGVATGLARQPSISRHSVPARALLLVACLMLVQATAALAQTISVYVSSSGGDRLSAKKPLRFAQAGTGQAATATFRLDENEKDQTMIGFGASFLEAGMLCLNSLPRDKQEAVLKALFDPKDGAGFSAMKTVIGATDFMSAGGWYTYNDTPGDMEMEHFSIQRDLGPNGLVTFIKRAQRYGKFVLQAPMDYPPDWMLVELNDRKRQDVNPKYYDALALYYLRYLQEYEKNGIFVDYLCLFNEPGVYTKIAYPKIRELLKNHVGPLFVKNNVKTRIQLSENPTRNGARKSYPVVLDDPQARKYVATLPYHGYDFAFFKRPQQVPATRENGYDYSEFASIAELHRVYPDLPLWMTEACLWNRGTPWAKPMPRYEFENGDFWGRQIIGDMKAGASGWTYWNMILDEEGGPELVSPIHGDNEGNKQHPVVIINRKTGEVTYTGLYYYLAHFSRFVRPGSVRVEAAGGTEDIEAVAFKRPDGYLVAQVVNSRKLPASAVIRWGDKSTTVALLPLSITTLLWK